MGPLQSDGMVLQQNADVKLWGWTQPNRKVSVKGSWNGKKMNTRSDDKGRFEITLRTGAGNFTPQTIEVNDGDKLIIRDVLIGEVWLCSGQSNMEMPLHGFSSCPVENSVEYIAEAGKYSGKLHLNFVSWSPAPEPADTVTDMARLYPSECTRFLCCGILFWYPFSGNVECTCWNHQQLVGSDSSGRMDTSGNRTEISWRKSEE